MQTNVSLISQFIGWDNIKEALAITDSCKSTDAFLALVDLNGSYLKVSDSAKNVIGCELNRLGTETIFSMTLDSERSDLFKACSTAYLEGSAYRISHHFKCSDCEQVPVVTHMKKVMGEAGRDLILCLNVKA